MPLKALYTLEDYQEVMGSVTLQDIYDVIELLGFSEESMTVCVGIASPSAAGLEGGGESCVDEHSSAGTGGGYTHRHVMGPLRGQQ
jgi:hypothetical protein